jgi:hypothetical protein
MPEIMGLASLWNRARSKLWKLLLRAFPRPGTPPRNPLFSLDCKPLFCCYTAPDPV